MGHITRGQAQAQADNEPGKYQLVIMTAEKCAQVDDWMLSCTHCGEDLGIHNWVLVSLVDRVQGLLPRMECCDRCDMPAETPKGKTPDLGWDTVGTIHD